MLELNRETGNSESVINLYLYRKSISLSVIGPNTNTLVTNVLLLSYYECNP